MPRPTPSVTPDGRYIVVDGLLWRRIRPDLDPVRKKRLLSRLGRARAAIRLAKQRDDAQMLRRARARVHRVKCALGERGSVWWNDGEPDRTRQPIDTTPYADWWAEHSVS